jgi:hypothetical protein
MQGRAGDGQTPGGATGESVLEAHDRCGSAPSAPGDENDRDVLVTCSTLNPSGLAPTCRLERWELNVVSALADLVMADLLQLGRERPS